jgi:hypothetical protein
MYICAKEFRYLASVLPGRLPQPRPSEGLAGAYSGGHNCVLANGPLTMA